ncbi:MAG: thiamine phosphate synthase, partial [Candidatus Eisenbacteria bacterium]
MHYAQEIRGVYVITDSVLRPDRSHLDIARAAIEGGSTIIQLRDKNAPDSELIAIAREMGRITSEAGAIFIVN